MKLYTSIFLSIFFVLTISTKTFSQCCGMGSPVGGNANAGVLNKKTLRYSTLYQYGYFETYYHKDVRLINYGPIKNSNYNFISLTMGYGLTKRYTIENEAGYYINKTQHLNDTVLDKLAEPGHGFASGVFSVKYGAYINPIKEFEVSVGAGLKYPFTTQPQIVNNVRLPLEVQPSARTFGFVGQLFLKKGFSPIGLNLLLLNRFETNRKNLDHYTLGNLNITSLFISKKIIPNFIGIIQIRNDLKKSDITEDLNVKLLSEGSHIIYVIPQLTYVVGGKWIVSAFCDLPVYKYYKGTADYNLGTGGQLSNKYACGISLSHDFKLTK
jgi:hypothetical protein